MYEINDNAESPDVEYPAVPPKQSFSSLPQHNARSTASYASLNYNGKVTVNTVKVTRQSWGSSGDRGSRTP